MLASIFRRWETRLSQRDTNRQVRPFEWGLDFIANGGPPRTGPANTAHDARRTLIEHADHILSDSDGYHSYEPVRDYRLDGDHLTFTSPVKTIYPKNDTVHGRYFPADSRGRVVLVLPQWNADSRGHISLCRMMRHFGLSSLRLSLPHHDSRMSEGLVRAEYMLSPNVGRTLQSIRQAVNTQT